MMYRSALLLLMATASAQAAPLTCDDVVEAYGEIRDNMGTSFGQAFGPDVFADWEGNSDEFRFNPPGTRGVETTLECAADGLFQGVRSISTWQGANPSIAEWTAAQLPVDLMAIAITGELGPNLADVLEEVFTSLQTSDGAGGELKSTRRVDDTYNAYVSFEDVADLQVLSFGIERRR